MGSYIQIDSISIDLGNSIGKRDPGKCEHFSIRGYVSEIRQKDWKIGWPFPVHESDKQSSLPPLDVPKYRCRCHQNSSQEIATKDFQKDDQKEFDCCITGCKSGTNCSNAAVAVKSGIQQDPMLDTLERREIDLNTNLSCVNDYLPISDEKDKKSGVVLSRMDLEIGLEDNLNHQVTSISSPKNYPDLAPEMHTSKRGCEGNEIPYVELASNLKYMDNKSSTEMCNGDTPADNQCQKNLTKTCTILGEGATVMEVGNIYDRTTGPPPESVACYTAPAGSMDNMVENDFQDHHLEKSTSLSRRRPRKVRLMTDLLSDNGEMKPEQIFMQESPSHGTSNVSATSQAHSILTGKMDIQGGLTLTSTALSRKRKFLLDEVRRPASMCLQRVENEVQNLEGDAKITDTVLDNKSTSKDVPAGLRLQDASKGHWSKPEIQRSHIVSKKKNKKIQVVEKCLIPKPPQGKQRENKDTMDAADKACVSKSFSSKLAARSFIGKGMDNFPIHTLRIENDFNLSKEKGKMLQTDGELDSLSCQKNSMLVQDSFAYSGEKNRSGMPVNVPIPSAQGMLNGKGLEEGLHLSLNSYLAAHVYNKKCIHQIENHLPFSLPFQEGTSKVPQLNRKDSDANVFEGSSITSKHPTNTLSGKGVHSEEINGARNTQKTIEAVVDDIPMEIVELLAKNQYERCLPDAENRSSILEKSTMGRKSQMIGDSTVHSKGEMSLLKESQKEKPQGRHKKNSMVMRGDNVKPGKRKPVHYFSPFDGNSLGMNNLCPPQSPFGFEVPQSQKKSSSGFQFSPMSSSQLGGSRNCRLNGSFEERGSSNATLQTPGGCSLHKNILQQDDEASRIWASLTPNHVSLGYDLPKKVVSPHTSSNMDITSLRTGPFHKQNMKRDIDLNYMNLNAAGLEKLSRNTGPGAFGRLNGEYSFPCKHNGMEPHQNLRGSLDLYSNDTIPAMHLLSLMDAGMQSRTPYDVGVSAQMLKRPSYPGDCNTKLEIGTSKAHSALKRPSSDYYSRSYLSDKPHGYFIGSPSFGASSSTQHDKKFMRTTGFNGQNSTKSGRKEKMKSSNSTLQNRVSKQLSWPRLETETSLQRNLDVNGTHETSMPLKIISGNSCMVNRNPADFTIPETGNIYMIRGEDLKFEKSTLKNRPRIAIPYGYKQQRNLKGTKMKEHSKH
ncbi:protein EMBRYONIC FLOWER 1 [Abrus precatorius]|uniref:Protein EMBRYONIC FLOWER 1 n=1 Tax=Abrus precatorius TaxID=3816 RepID=A0A8B8LFN5_ABRPR|nr:protein EMBRYONIC FLOWER 1 [Abrus precatorius]XP_027355165.1 protein EMBRYONIC FLOWER 1 [Abrus precatorius]XP_027355166.1 protein EMBRYONIC FLOWER 1 [Abrus precatorius]XP_027355167.1 protein EMBRYONIC FLOWER 1 [Abrus precatorius]